MVVYRFEWTVSDGLVMFVVLPAACQSSMLHAFFLSGLPASPKKKCALLNMIQFWTHSGASRKTGKVGSTRGLSGEVGNTGKVGGTKGLSGKVRKTGKVGSIRGLSDMGSCAAGRLGRWAVLEASQTWDVELGGRGMRNTWTYWRQSPVWQTLLNVSLQRKRGHGEVSAQEPVSAWSVSVFQSLATCWSWATGTGLAAPAPPPPPLSNGTHVHPLCK